MKYKHTNETAIGISICILLRYIEYEFSLF